METARTLHLIAEAQNNDLNAKEELVKENSPLIKSVIKRFINKGIDYEDLYQLGSLGFLKAINNFDPSFNVKFSTYAVPMISGEVKRFLRDNGILKVSRATKTLSVRINKFVEEYLSQHDKSPNVEEIAKHFDVLVEDVVFAMESNKPIMSLNTLIGEDDGGKQMSMFEKVADESAPIEKSLDNMLLYDVIKDLPARDKKIIILRYFRDKTQKDIAQELGVSQVQISRLENKILQKLKNQFVIKDI